jgi:hypothetical protein
MSGRVFAGQDWDSAVCKRLWQAHRLIRRKSVQAVWSMLLFIIYFKAISPDNGEMA